MVVNTSATSIATFPQRIKVSSGTVSRDGDLFSTHVTQSKTVLDFAISRERWQEKINVSLPCPPPPAQPN